VPNDNSSGHVKSVNKVISTASAMMYNTYDQSKHRNSYNCYSDEALTQTTQCYGASAIGDGAFLHLDDHVNGLSTLARMGKAIPRTYLLKITDAANREVKLPQAAPKQVVKPDAAYIVNDMASDWKASYLPGSCTETNCTRSYKFQRYNGWHFAVKTGTTNDGYDGLMTSWSTKYATVSWVGNHTRHVTLNTSMEILTEPLTRGWMEYAHRNLKPVNWQQPSSVKTAPAFIVRNHIHFGDIEPSPTNDLFPSWYVGGNKTKNSSATIDKVSNKIATNCTPPAAKEFVSNANAATWNIDIFKGGKQNIGSSSSGSSGSTTSAATDDVHNCNDSPPTVTLTAPADCNTSCVITATVSQGTHALTDPQYPLFPGTLVISLNGQTIKTASVGDSPSTVSFTYTPSGTGSGTLKAVVTDSVLYQGTDSRTLNFTAAPQTVGATAITGFTATAVGGTTTFNWSGGSGPFTVFRTSTNQTLCTTSGGNCSVSIALAPKGVSVTVRDTSNQTAQTTVTGP
jgi:hypothetical protein